ncbi:hypothetical protein HDU91_000791 [Kappamyces sp. JEL0680]|nr:hypothetical protein HDU91_000791 [Kappamyces sp. JEL0680]
MLSQQKTAVLVKSDTQTSLNSATGGEKSEPALSPAMEEFEKFSKTFLAELSIFADSYEAFFVSKRTEPSLIPELDSLKRGVFASSLSDKNNLSHSAFSQCVQILNILRNEVRGAVVLRNLAAADKRMSLLTVTVLDRIIQGVFGKVNQDFFEKVNSLTATPDAQMFNIVRQMTNWIKETLIAKALPALEDFVRPDTSNSLGPSEILARIKEALIRFWTDLATEMMGSRRAEVFSSLLVLSRLCSEWSKGVIESIFSMYNERLFVKAAGGLYIPGLSELEINKCAVDITAQYQALSQRLLSRYAQLQIAAFTLKIRDYAAHPLLVDQVTMVSPLWRQCQTSLDEIQHQVRNSLKEESKLQGKSTIVGAKTVTGATTEPAKSRSGLRKGAVHGSMQFDTLMDTLDKLFDERLTYLPQKIELKAPVVMSIITKSILKVTFRMPHLQCLIEEVRLTLYKPTECHQLEVDMAFVRENLGEWLDPKVLETLIGQVLKSVFQNCDPKPSPMDPRKLEAIVGRL